MNEKIIIAIIGVALLGAGCTRNNVSTNSTTPNQTVEQTNAVTPTQNQQTDPGSPPQEQQKEQPATRAGSYADYSTDATTKASSGGGKVVLFFHADWCPFCVQADKQFKARTNEIPAGVTVLKTNYDTETALKKKYVVTYQHTFVQIDANGNQVSKWNGGDVESLKKYLK